MRNAELTKKNIVECASELFNTQGYKATSISDITKKSALTKGAIYRHFQNKSELEKEALQYMCNTMFSDISKGMKTASDTKSKLNCILEYFKAYSKKAPFKGGCPLMNAAIEADDNNPELKSVVQSIMTNIHGAIVKVINNGIKHQQIEKGTNASATASVFIASLEGGVMMLKVLDSNKHLLDSIKFMEREIERILV